MPASASEQVSAASLEARTTQCLADLALAWRALAELTEHLIALHEDPWLGRRAFLAQATAFTERTRDVLDEAGGIVGAVPDVVHQEVERRLTDKTYESLLIQAAIIRKMPVA